MTPAQMLRQIEAKKSQVTKAPTIIIPFSGRQTMADIHFQEESLALIQGICPKCSAKVDVLPMTGDGMLRFECNSHPVYHYFTRSENFLKFD